MLAYLRSYNNPLFHITSRLQHRVKLTSVPPAGRPYSVFCLLTAGLYVSTGNLLPSCAIVKKIFSRRTELDEEKEQIIPRIEYINANRGEKDQKGFCLC